MTIPPLKQHGLFAPRAFEATTSVGQQECDGGMSANYRTRRNKGRFCVKVNRRRIIRCPSDCRVPFHPEKGKRFPNRQSRVSRLGTFCQRRQSVPHIVAATSGPTDHLLGDNVNRRRRLAHRALPSLDGVHLRAHRGGPNVNLAQLVDVEIEHPLQVGGLIRRRSRSTLLLAFFRPSRGG